MSGNSRGEAIRVLEQTRAEIGALFAQLSDEQISRRATIGGGDWSAKDLIGHIAAWETYALETLEEIRRGKRPAIESVFQEKGGVDRLNDGAILRDASLPLQEVRSRDVRIHQDLIAQISNMKDEEWNAPYSANIPEIATVGLLLGSITAGPNEPFAHPKAHFESLQDYVESLRKLD